MISRLAPGDQYQSANGGVGTGGAAGRRLSGQYLHGPASGRGRGDVDCAGVEVVAASFAGAPDLVAAAVYAAPLRGAVTGWGCWRTESRRNRDLRRNTERLRQWRIRPLATRRGLPALHCSSGPVLLPVPG